MSVARIDIGFRSERGPILIALMLATGLIAIESTILATAVPSIVKDLGGFSQFPWLFSIYLLAQAVSVPVYSKLSDVVGRKPMLLIGIGLFLLGSILCGFAWSMPALIAFRAVQGLGAGAVLPMSVTIAGDIYTVAERAKTQAYLASVWAVSSVVGPTLGGLFAEFSTWRWIFFINIPLCLIAAWMLARTFHETVQHRPHKVDYLGATLLMLSLSALLLAVLEGGQSWAWASPQSIAAFAVGAVLLVAFVFAERRAEEPVLPMWVFSRRVVLTSSLISLGVGAIMLGLTSFVPTYLEGSLGATPILGGLAVAALTIGWPVSASQSGRLYLRIGFRATVLIGMAITVVGTVVLALTAATPSVVTVAMCCFVIGLGLGLVATPSLIAAQSSVGWDERGVATGTSMFARSIGSAVGVAIFGAVANAIYTLPGNTGHGPQAITDASSAVFLALAITAVATVAAAFYMPRTKPLGVESVPVTP